MAEHPTKKSESLFPFFSFKNKETEREILKVISQNEGILPERLKEYISFVHSKKNADLFIEDKLFINSFWKRNNHLSLSEVVGLFDIALMDIKLDVFKKGDDFVRKSILMRRQKNERTKRTGQ